MDARHDHHYFDPSPPVASRRRKVTLTLPDLTVDLHTDNGVFSADRIDPGTRFLLLEAPRPTQEMKHIADVGCGYGPIAVSLAVRASGAKIWAIDVNERALSLCRENLVSIGASDHVEVCFPDGVPSHVTFDAIWSNPPIRIGKKALQSLLLTWLRRLRPDGHAYLVVQRHLGADSLQRWLESQGWQTTRIGSRSGYRLLDVTQGDTR